MYLYFLLPFHILVFGAPSPANGKGINGGTKGGTKNPVVELLLEELEEEEEDEELLEDKLLTLEYELPNELNDELEEDGKLGLEVETPEELNEETEEDTLLIELGTDFEDEELIGVKDNLFNEVEDAELGKTIAEVIDDEESALPLAVPPIVETIPASQSKPG